MVVGAFWSAATRTNRHRLHGNTAQKTCQPPSLHQSMTRCSPGTGTQGRKIRRWRCQRFLAAATARRKLRAEPA
jgi:hypothetical protein